jgi:predicted MPP superfamily phosphohydrolase
VKPPFLPPPLIPVRNRRYTAGAFDVGPGRMLYINRGLGHLVRVRFNVRPEITLFTLQRVPGAPTAGARHTTGAAAGDVLT